MVKTHEKSRIYAVVGTDNVKNIGKVVLQMEATGADKRRLSYIFS